MGPLTSVPFFQSSILQQLQDLEVQVSADSSQVCDKDISVDDLKKASEAEDAPSEGIADDTETSNDKKKSRKRKSRKTDYHTLDDTSREEKAFWSHIAKKVEHIKKIKETQDEDKAVVTLHSFNPSLKIKGSRAVISGTIKRLKPLGSASSEVKVKSSNNISIQDCIPVHHPEVALFAEVCHNVRL